MFEYILEYPYLVYSLFSLSIMTVFLGYALNLFYKLKHRALLYFLGLVMCIWFDQFITTVRNYIGFFTPNVSQDILYLINILIRIGTITTHVGVIFLFIFIESLEKENLPTKKIMILGFWLGILISLTFNYKYFAFISYSPVLRTYVLDMSLAWALTSFLLVITTAAFLIPALLKQKERAKDKPELRKQINLVYLGTIFGVLVTPIFVLISSLIGTNQYNPFFNSEGVVISIAILFFIIGIRSNPQITYITSSKVYGIYLMTPEGKVKYQYLLSTPQIREETLKSFLDALHEFARYMGEEEIHIKEIKMYGFALIIETNPRFTLILISDRVTRAAYESIQAIASKLEKISNLNEIEDSRLDKIIRTQLFYA